MREGTEVFSLTGCTALVTGATGYLGSAMTFVLAEAGARVYVNSRSSERATSLVAQLNGRDLAAETAVFDVTSSDEVRNFAAGMAGNPLHILINNAYAGGAGTVRSANEEDYADSYNITVTGAHRLVSSLLPNLRSAVQQYGDASIVNVASMYALVSPDQRIYGDARSTNPPFYGAAKAALLHWSRYAACEFGREGIRVNSIAPGPFPSGRVQESDPAFIERLCQKVPLGRIGQVDEIKGPILFLASQASSFVNGANLSVDGGWTSW